MFRLFTVFVFLTLTVDLRSVLAQVDEFSHAADLRDIFSELQSEPDSYYLISSVLRLQVVMGDIEGAAESTIHLLNEHIPRLGFHLEPCLKKRPDRIRRHVFELCHHPKIRGWVGDDPSRQSSWQDVLVRVIELSSEAGDVELAKRAFSSVAGDLQEFTLADWRDRVRSHKIGAAIAMLSRHMLDNNGEEANELIAKISDIELKHHIFQNAATPAISGGQLACVSAINQELGNKTVLRRLNQKQFLDAIDQRDFELAKSILDRIAETSPDDYFASSFKLGKLMLLMKENVKARELMLEVTDASNLAAINSSRMINQYIFDLLIELGQDERVLDLCGQFRTFRELEHVVNQLARRGELDRALRLAESIDDSMLKSRTLAKIGRILEGANEEHALSLYAEALELILQIDDSFGRNMALTELVRVRDYEMPLSEIQQLYEHIDPESNRVDALADAVANQIRLRLPLPEIDEQLSWIAAKQPSALPPIIVSLAKTNDLDRAIKTLKLIGDDSVYEQAALSVVKAMGRTGITSRLHEIISFRHCDRNLLLKEFLDHSRVEDLKKNCRIANDNLDRTNFNGSVFEAIRQCAATERDYDTLANLFHWLENCPDPKDHIERLCSLMLHNAGENAVDQLAARIEKPELKKQLIQMKDKILTAQLQLRKFMGKVGRLKPYADRINRIQRAIDSKQ